MTDCGIPREKITVIKNGVDMDLFDLTVSGAAMRKKLGVGERVIAAYFGTHGMAHHLETVFEAASLLTEREDIVFVLVGEGAERARLLKLKQQMKLDNVVMLEQQPKALMPELWAMADISLVLLRRTDLFKTVIPSKIFEAMGMATPIILGVAGEAREIVEAADGGLCIEPENAAELAAAVITLADDADHRRRVGKSAYEFVGQNFDRHALAARYLDVLDGQAARPAELRGLGNRHE